MSQIVVNFISMGPVDLHPHIRNMLTSYHYNTNKASSINSEQRLQRDTSAGAGLCQKLHACHTQLHMQLVAGSVVAEYIHVQLSRVYLPSTCDITHMITYTRLSSCIFCFWVRG